MILHPSLASADPLRLHQALSQFDHAPIGSWHLDIEDTSFISNITFGLKTVRSVFEATQHPLSFHLMVANPWPWFRALSPFTPAWVFVHAEALANPAEALTAIRDTGARAGLAFNPATPLEPYLYLRHALDACLIMTSEPDGHGQCFNPALIGKVAACARYFPDAECWADGGISESAGQQLKRAGAEHLVLGRALFASDNPATTLGSFRSALNG